MREVRAEEGDAQALRTVTMNKGCFCSDFRASTGIVTGHQKVTADY